jgi:cupin 2 domain-containing protein
MTGSLRMDDLRNVFADIPSEMPGELVQMLLGTPSFRIERIVSRGHNSPEGFRYDQEMHEWVLLLSGVARPMHEGEEPIDLLPGAFVNIPAHRRHRVEGTEPARTTIRPVVHHGGRA